MSDRAQAELELISEERRIAEALQVYVNVQDDDMEHIESHHALRKILAEAIRQLDAHVELHFEQRRNKRLILEMAEKITSRDAA